MVAVNDLPGATFVAVGGIWMFALAGLVLLFNFFAAVTIKRTVAKHWLVPWLVALYTIPGAAYFGVVYYGGFFTTDINDTVGLPQILYTWVLPPYLLGIGLLVYGMLGSMDTPRSESDPTNPDSWAIDGHSLGLGTFLELWSAAGVLLGGLSLIYVDFTITNYGSLLPLAVGGVILIGIPFLANTVQVYSWVKRYKAGTLGPRMYKLPGGQFVLIVVAVFLWLQKLAVIILYSVSIWTQPGAVITTVVNNFQCQEGIMIMMVSMGTLVTIAVLAFTWFVRDGDEYDGPSGKRSGGKVAKKTNMVGMIPLR